MYASTATLQEIIFWFFNRGLQREMIPAINAISHIDNVRWIPLTPEICLTSTMLIKEYSINPFDAYHAATAVYDRIKGITKINPETYASQI